MTDKLKVTNLSYSTSTKKAFSTSLDDKVTFSKQITKSLEASDGKFLHIAVTATFANSKEHPSQVYL